MMRSCSAIRWSCVSTTGPREQAIVTTLYGGRTFVRRAPHALTSRGDTGTGTGFFKHCPESDDGRQH